MELGTSVRRVRSWCLLGLLSLLLSPLLADSSSASPQGPWSGGINLSQAPGYASQALIAEDGTTTVIWSNFSQVMTATRAPGESGFEAPTAISTASVSWELDAAIAPNGSITVAWSNNDGSISAVTRPPGGAFGPEEQVAPAVPGFDPSYPNVYGIRVASSNDVTAVAWTRVNGMAEYVEAATRTGQEGFSTPVVLSPTADVAGRSAQDVEIAIGPDGTATVVWTQQEPGSRYVLAASREPGAGFGAPLVLSEGGRVPHLAFSESGLALVAWSKEVRGDTKIQIVTRPSEGRFTLPRSFASKGSGSVRGTGYLVRRVAFTGDGTAVIAANLQGETGSAQVMTRQPDGRFSKPQIIPGGDGLFLADMSAGQDGTINVISNTYADLETAVMVSTRLPGGAFGQPVMLEELSSGASSVATGPGGLATATWSVGGFGKFDYPEVKTASTSPDTGYCGRTTMRFGRSGIDRRTGTGHLKVVTGTQGTLTLVGTPRVRATRLSTPAAGTSRIQVKARGQALRALKKDGRTRVKVTVSFRPGFGCATKSRTRQIKLVRSTR